jgi:hypothetical protein
MEVSNIHEVVKMLQVGAKKFICENYLELNGLKIEPKEVEVYYYKDGVFEDNSVHRNELQSANPNKFYIHRKGQKSTDSYKGGHYGGMDFVISDELDVYHTYLIRSAVVEGHLIVGPNRLMRHIIELTHWDKKEIEDATVDLKQCENTCDVLTSSRINLGKTVGQEYLLSPLRLVLCDDYYLKSTYPMKESMLVDFLLQKYENRELIQEEILAYSKERLGYISSRLKQL